MLLLSLHIRERAASTNTPGSQMTTAPKFRKVLKVFGTDYPTEDGTAVRDYVHPTDLATAHISSFLKLLANEKIEHRIFNLGTNVGSSVLDVLKVRAQR